MQLGIRLHDTKKLPFEERIANVHELGFACGHLAPGKVITEFPTTDEALTPGLAMYMKNVFAKNQVDVAVLGCYLNLANPNPEQLAKITHRYMAHIRFASWLGCGVVGTETGAPNETYTAVPECHGEEALQTFITNLRPVVNMPSRWVWSWPSSRYGSILSTIPPEREECWMRSIRPTFRSFWIR